ncbi:lipopolysaccharide assembly protein LapB [Psychroserpens sp. SPM9]|uniref:tetratricopeptide repeat protein n=1 Tax=Psychroserpens sp. SPM9 TaxID=2975598 RepID=UPI0021A4C186|nr:tetratricopeptide repeat protein [Psychroserpens sp. SPM9]MDG5491515.1 tetratricopeptide repeat protein [Psychroserpens sp. SPM9]
MMESANLQRGIQLFEIGRYKEAIPYFKSAISEDTDDFYAKFLLANCLFQTDAIDKAFHLTLELRRVQPNNGDVYFLLSQLYLHKEDDKEALMSINKAIELNPYDENYFGQKSYIYLYQKKYTEALDFANEGLRINAKSTFCLNARTTALTKLNRKDEVVDTISDLLNDNPENAYSHANAGWSYLENNKTQKALTHFKEALKLNPNLEYARSGMLTAVKSKNKIYNLYLRYAFWMSNKSQANQWVFIIGIYLVYRFSIKALSATGMTYLAIPLIIAYLLFALGSWIMDPLSNMLLLFDKFGKFLLDEREKLTGQVMFGLLLASLIMFLCSLVIAADGFVLMSLTFLAAILPLTRGFSSEKQNPRLVNIAYGSLMILIALVGTLMGVPFGTIGLIVGIMFIAYTWLGNFISGL